MNLKFLLIYLFITSLVSAQTAKQAETFFNSKKYSEAKSIYENLLHKKPNDFLLNFKYARCCYELKNDELAIKHFEIAVPKFPQSNLYLAEIYYNNYNFELASQAYKIYISNLDSLDKQITGLNMKLKNAELGAKLIRRVEDITIIDSIVVNKSEFLKFYKIGKELGSIEQKRLKLNNRQIVDKISFTTQRNDRMFFSDSTHNNTDIFSSIKLLNEWSLPISISSKINTEANENYPFLLLDGITMYFASDGVNSLGGYDIFVTKYSSVSQDYLQPENIGFPFNSLANDYMMIVDEQNNLAWFATDRNQPSTKVMIYKFVFNQTKTYVSNDDFAYIKQVALLKLYKKTLDKSIILTNEENDITTLLKNESKIIINDSTIYIKPIEFKNKEALKSYTEYSEFSSNLKLQQKELQNLRHQYENIENAESIKQIAEKIIEKEQYLIKLELAKNQKEISYINEENKYLEKRQFSQK